jgi:hypothetical protein
MSERLSAEREQTIRACFEDFPNQIATDLFNEIESLRSENARLQYLIMVGTVPLTSDTPEGVAQNEVIRLSAVLRESWRFWAAIQDSAVQAVDRGYTLLRVRTDRYQAFDALFRRRP